MRRKILLALSFAVLAATLLLSGSGTVALSGNLSAVDVASKDLVPAARAGASDALSNLWVQSPPSLSTLFSLNGVHPSGTPEGRRTGLDAQVQAMFETGDPLIGATVADDPVSYLLGTTGPNVTAERGYARARAFLIEIRSGFAIVPGGAAEAFRRIQTCLDGSLQSNEPGGNTVFGVPLFCELEPNRRAMADTIAKGFYLGFGSLPAVGFGCDEMLAQAEGGSTVEARWAAAQAYVQGCGPDLEDVAVNGGSAELRFAAVAPLAEQLAASRGADPSAFLSAAASAASAELGMAYAWAAGLLVESGVSMDATGNAVAPVLGNLHAFGAANYHVPLGSAAVAPFARFYANDLGLSGPLKLTVARQVSGAELPLWSFLQTQ
jgi:hypothetical protein